MKSVINFLAYPDHLNMLNLVPLSQDSENAVLVGTSPFTGSEYTITSITKNQLRGYQVTINIADCTTGHDWLAVNDMSSALELTLLFLQNALLKNGCRLEAIYAFSLTSAEIEKVTLLFHVGFPNTEEAIHAKIATYRHAEAIHNYRIREQALPKDPVYWKGSSHHGFWTLENPRYCLRVSTNTRDYPPQDSTTGVSKILPFDEASRYLTYELELREPWLIKAKLNTPAAWIKAGNRAYDKAWALIERALWSDFKFRRRLPRPDDKPSDLLVDRDLSDWYFLGHNVREHPVVQDHADPEQSFLKSNQRIRNLLHIDYRIPWKITQQYIAHDIKRLLAVSDPSRIQLPKTMTQNRFGPETAPNFIKAMKAAITTQNAELRQSLQMTGSDNETPSSVAEKPFEKLSQSKSKSKQKPKPKPNPKSKSRGQRNH